MSHGVGTMAVSCAFPILPTDTLACPQHFLANAIRAARDPRSAATLSSADSSAVILPFATPSVMSRTRVPDMCTTS